MTRKARYLVHGSIIAALYAALSHFQNLLIPGSGTWAIQFRASESLCILAFFTPAAIPGLAVGCLIFNLTFVGALPLDFLVGSLATAAAAGGMFLLRKKTFRGLPLPGLLLPALCNGLLVGWELKLYLGSPFWLNFFYIAIGELAVMLTLGAGLYRAIRRRRLDWRIFY